MILIMAILIFFLSLLLFLYLHKPGDDIRFSLVKVFISVFFLIAVSTEILSILEQVNFWGLVIFWGSGILFLSILIFRKEKKSISSPKMFQEKWMDLRKFSKPELMMIAGILFILAITLLIALLSPPNNVDSMTYHMARVANWIQQESVKFYPTSIPRQNYSMPLAEYGILHLQLLSRSDRLANLIQWSSFLFSIILSSLLAKEFDLSQHFQLFSAVLAATLPMAILQSSSTQNDLVVGVMVLSFSYFLFRSVRYMKIEDVVYSAISLGLALLSKGTAYIYCAGMGIGIGLVPLFSYQKKDKSVIIFYFAGIIAGGLLINSGHYLRSQYLYGNPIFTGVDRITVDHISLRNIYENIVRNLALHFATPIPEINEGLAGVVRYLLGGVADNPQSTFTGTKFDIFFTINEDFSGNLLHIVLIGMSLGVLPWGLSGKDRLIIGYLSGALLAGFLFTTLIKWQPWASRLHTGWFFLFLPIVVYLIGQYQKNFPIPILLITVFVIFYSVPFVFLNNSKPVLPIFEKNSIFYQAKKIRKYFSDRPKKFDKYREILLPFYREKSIFHTNREELIFSNQEEKYQDFLEGIDVIKNAAPEKIGVFLDNNGWEYPIWVLLNKHAQKRKPEINHVKVPNVSKKIIESGSHVPDLIITNFFFRQYEFDGLEYEVIYFSDSIIILRRKTHDKVQNIQQFEHLCNFLEFKL